MTARYDDEHYSRIADIVRSAALTHQEIADAYGVPRTTVIGWVNRARSRGLIPKTSRGKGIRADHSCLHCGAARSASAAYRRQMGRP